MNDNEYKRYIDLYNFANNELLELLSSRKLNVCLYNDAILNDEKNYYKSQIDVIDGKLNFICQSQNLILQKLKRDLISF